MTRSRRPLALLTLALLSGGCDFGDYEPLVPSAAVNPITGSVAVTADGEHLWLTDFEDVITSVERLVITDANDGSVLKTIGPFSTEWGVREITPEYETGAQDDMWVLHHNGWRTRWSPSGAITKFEGPVPNELYPAGYRFYCSFTRDVDHGYTFIAAKEGTGMESNTYLYRYDGVDWDRTLLGSSCWNLTYDAVTDEVVANYLSVAQWHDPEDLSVQHEVDYDIPYGVHDIVAFNRMSAVTEVDAIELYDESGALIDVVPDINADGLHVHYGSGTMRLFFAGVYPYAPHPNNPGPDATAVGSFALEGS